MRRIFYGFCLVAFEIAGLSAQSGAAPRDYAPSIDSVPVHFYPRYATGHHAQVALKFVVDTTGRVDPASIVVLSSSDSAFNRAAQRTVREAYFSHGRLQGRVAPVLVSQVLTFEPGSVDCGHSLTPAADPDCADSTRAQKPDH